MSEHKMSENIFSKSSIKNKLFVAERIHYILNIYDNNKSNNNIYDTICKLYSSSDVNYFIYDYYLYISNMKTNGYYKEGGCNMNTCKYISRCYRDRTKNETKE